MYIFMELYMYLHIFLYCNSIPKYQKKFVSVFSLFHSKLFDNSSN